MNISNPILHFIGKETEVQRLGCYSRSLFTVYFNKNLRIYYVLGTVLSTRNSKKNKIKFLPKGTHSLVGIKDADGSMFREPAEKNQLIYPGGF